MKRTVDFWETLYHPSNEAVENLIQKFEENKITPKEVFRELKNIEVDFYPEADITKETINKVFDVFIKAGHDENDIKNIYDIVQRETMFDALQEKHPNAYIAFCAYEFDGLEIEQWGINKTYEETKTQIQNFIQEKREYAPEIHLYKLLVENIGENISIIYEEPIEVFDGTSEEVNGGVSEEVME